MLALLLSAGLGVDAKKRGRSPRKSEKLYRKSKKYAKKLRGFWLRLGVQPFIVEEGKVGEPCMLKSEVEAGYLRRSTVSRDYVRKSEVACAGVVVEGDVGDGARRELAPHRRLQECSCENGAVPGPGGCAPNAGDGPLWCCEGGTYLSYVGPDG